MRKNEIEERHGSSETKTVRMSGKIRAMSTSASLIGPTSCDLIGLNQPMLNLILNEETRREKCDEWIGVSTIKFGER